MKRILLSVFALAMFAGAVLPASAQYHHHRHCSYRHHHRVCR